MTLTWLANHLWQSTICAAIVWLIAWRLEERPARIRYRLTKAGAEIVQTADPCVLPKARKNRIEQEGERRHDAMANMLARPESLVDYLHHQLAFVIDRCGSRLLSRPKAHYQTVVGISAPGK